MRGLIFNIQRHSTEDGPGIRTTLFLKGCPMRCPWCHNPEGMKGAPDLIWYEYRCIGAMDCVRSCTKGALSLSPGGLTINRHTCDVCGDCALACPSGALEVVGERYTVDEAVGEALRDRVFYEKSGGGVTLSGGEPSTQLEFCRAVMETLKREGVHVALDTCGAARWETLRNLASLADLVLYDIKLMEAERHLCYTGVPLQLVLENAREISRMGKPIWVRTPVIPGYTDSEENVRLVARFIESNLLTAERYDLLAFNNVCSAKYRRLGLNWRLEGQDLVADETMESLARAARNEWPGAVHWSGITRARPARQAAAES